jgi:hypothetical protein
LEEIYKKVVFTSFNFLTHFSFKKVYNTLKGLSHEMDLAFVISRKDENKRVQRGLVGSALACCKAGPSSNLGSAPQGGFPH